MARTISNKRGSVRGAPPQVYVPFSSFTSEADEGDVFRPVIFFFGGLIKAAIAYVITIFFIFLFWLFFLNSDMQ